MPAITAEEIRELVARALAEDLGDGDVTGEATVPAEATATARIVQKAPGSSSGSTWWSRRCGRPGWRTVGARAEGLWRQEVPTEVLVAEGSARAILTAERTALNFLGRLSGVATLTARYVEAVAGTNAQDPRHPQDHTGAAQAGEGGRRGGRRHQPPHGPLRHRPDQGEPHRRRRRHPEAVYAARKAHPELPVEVEVRNLDETAYALGTGADQLLLDNMDPPTMREAVELRDAHAD